MAVESPRSRSLEAAKGCMKTGRRPTMRCTWNLATLTGALHDLHPSGAMRHAWLAGLASILSCFPRTGVAQVPAWYPPHNLVVPTVSVAVSLDSTTADFRDNYTVANGSTAQQRITFKVNSRGDRVAVLCCP